MAAPESSAFGTNPRAPLDSISEPKSIASRLDVSTIDVCLEVAALDADVEAGHVGELDVEEDDVGAKAAERCEAGGSVHRPRRRP